MSMIPEDVIENVRESADVIGIIGESVELKRAGADWRGPCPFHGGKNRNFAVIPKKGLFYCYVCHEAGDVFSYLMKRFGMDYPTAVRDVARRSGIVIPERTERAGPDPNEPLYSAASAAHEWFVRQLRERADAEAARSYLTGRDLPLDTAAQVGLGYAPQGKAFLDAMAELRIDEATLVSAGLAIRREDGSVGPRFRGRLIFPIRDQRGRVVAFGGRILGEGEPKYLNSPETPIFHKGKSLYNLDVAKNAIRKEETAIVVEGYFDVIRLVLAGVEHVVAPLGTSLTADQAALLRRLAPAVIMLYDSDQAGLKATFRAGDELLRQGVRVRVATMPQGEDPDTLVRKGGAAALEPILRDAVDLLDRKIQLLDQRGWFEGTEHRRSALDRLLPTIRAAADPITRELYLTRVAERSGVSKIVLDREVALQPRRTEPPPPPRRAPPAGATPVPAAARFGSRVEDELLRVFLADPAWLERAAEEVPPSLFETAPRRELYESFLAHGADGTAQLPPGLSHEAQLLWEKLKARAISMGQHELARVYEGARLTMELRPEFLALDALADPAEKRARLDAMMKTDPQVEVRYRWWKAARREAQR